MYKLFEFHTNMYNVALCCAIHLFTCKLRDSNYYYIIIQILHLNRVFNFKPIVTALGGTTHTHTSTQFRYIDIKTSYKRHTVSIKAVMIICITGKARRVFRISTARAVQSS